MMIYSPEDRERVARIIDPEAWDEISAEDNEEGAAIFADAWDVALFKAGQILEALSSPMERGGGATNQGLSSSRDLSTDTCAASVASDQTGPDSSGAER